MDPFALTILLTFVTTTVLWMVVKGIYEMFKCVNYKKNFDKNFDKYWDYLQETCPGINENQLQMGYRAGYYQCFFGKGINED